MKQIKKIGKEWQMFHVVLSFMIVIFALWYFTLKVDLVPAALGPIGYIDDIIIFFLAIYFVYKLFERAKTRYRQGQEQGIWRQGKILKAFLKPKTWLSIIILAGALWYMHWSWGLIPDVLVGIGYIDKVLVLIAAAIALIKLNRN